MPKKTSLISEEKPLNEEIMKVSRKGLYLILFFVLIALVSIGYLFKEKFVAAIVNGKPILSYQLNQRLISTYGKETLENIIVEKLIKDEAKNKGVTVSQADIDSEIAKLEKSLGNGMKIEDALKLQGVTLAEFKDQLTLRLQVNKILEKEITVSSDEIDKYLKDNAKTIVATSESERKDEAKQKLIEQKLSDRVQTWVSELLAKAKITRFLK